MTIYIGAAALLVCELAPYVALQCHTPTGPVTLTVDEAEGVDSDLLYCVVSA